MLLACVFMFAFGGRGSGAFCPDRRQKTEDRRQKTEDRRQKTEDRRQKTEDERVCAGRKYSSRSIRLWLLHGVSLSVMSKADNRAELPPTGMTFCAVVGARVALFPLFLLQRQRASDYGFRRCGCQFSPTRSKRMRSCRRLALPCQNSMACGRTR